MPRNNGFALIFAIIMLSLIILIMSSFFAITSGDLSLSNTSTNTIRAYYLAEAGLAKRFVDLRGGDTAIDLRTETITFAAGNDGIFSVKAEPISGSNPAAYTLTSTGTYKGINKTLTLTVQQVSCTYYLYLSGSEGEGFFNSYHLMSGPVHTNNQLNIWHNPVFEGPVSSVATSLNYMHGGPPEDNPDFRDSLTLGAPSIALPSLSDLITPLSDAAKEPEGKYFSGDTLIIFQANGRMLVKNPSFYPQPISVDLPANKAIFVDGAVNVQGTLKGQITVGASDKIHVRSDLRYSKNPEQYPDSTDVLGLVSQTEVSCNKAVSYIYIDAYIVAPYGSWTGGASSDPYSATAIIYGGVAQLQRPENDLHSIYKYDTRLKNIAPPYFPTLKDGEERVIYTKTQWAEL